MTEREREQYDGLKGENYYDGLSTSSDGDSELVMARFIKAVEIQKKVFETRTIWERAGDSLGVVA